MRLGPFDLFASTGLDAIYTTNVEGERGKRKEGELEREDYYLLYTLDMNMDLAEMSDSELTLDTALSVEKHFVRDDLDNASDPFGQARLRYVTDLGRFDLATDIELRRENTLDEESSARIYIPGQDKDRIVQDTRTFSQTVDWEWEPLRWNAGYSYQQTRFAEKEYQEGDEDLHTMDFGINWDIIRWGGEHRLDTFYTYNRTKTELKNKPDVATSGEWEITEAIGVNLQILTRPDFNYKFSYQRDDKADWRPVHTFALSDTWDLSPTMLFDYSLQYVIDQQERVDDISFIYAAGLEHEIGRTLRHSLRATREPVNTFGSTTDTDSTTVSYSLTKDDLFFANVSLDAGVVYQKNKPQSPEAEPTEETWTYTVTLAHDTAVSRRLTRRLAYEYRNESSNLEDGSIEEHRLTLGFVFTF